MTVRRSGRQGKRVVAPRFAFAVSALLSLATCAAATAQEAKPNILVIFGDDIGQTNVSAYSEGLMGYRHARTSTGSPGKG